jgi:putative transposase
MSVAYFESSKKSSQKVLDAACRDVLEDAVAAEKVSEREALAAGSGGSGEAAGRNGNSPKPASKRTPAASEPLFSMDGFSVSGADELRGLMHASLKGFAVEMGVQIAAHLLEEDVVRLCGQKNSRDPNRENCRHGNQPGYVILGGQKVAVRRPRVRSIGGVEVDLDVYSMLQSADAMPDAALTKMVRGVSCRDYEAVVETARAGFGVKKSSVSKNFVQASAEQLQKFDQRRFDDVTFAAIFIDGVAFGGEVMVVALGVDNAGRKHVLGLRQGKTENAEVVKDLLCSLRDRGVDTTRPTLFCLDGAKALRAAVKTVFGDNAVIQRCQFHKIRNVESYLSKTHGSEAHRRMNDAYAQTHYEDAKRLLAETVTWLQSINRDAASSLEEGLEETLTVIRLGLTGDLRQFFRSTNAIESLFSRVRDVSRRVKRWTGGDMRHRWCVAGIQRAEEGFRRVRGYKDIPKLMEAVERHLLDNTQTAR